MTGQPQRACSEPPEPASAAYSAGPGRASRAVGPLITVDEEPRSAVEGSSARSGTAEPQPLTIEYQVVTLSGEQGRGLRATQARAIYKILLWMTAEDARG